MEPIRRELQTAVEKTCRFSCSRDFKAGPTCEHIPSKEIRFNYQLISLYNAPEDAKICLQGHYELTISKQLVSSGRELKPLKFLFASASSVVHSKSNLIGPNAPHGADDARESKPSES